jgi:trigger factor
VNPGTVDRPGDFVVITVEVDESELAPAIEQAWKDLAREVRLPGFRPGKAPRRLLEAQFGSGHARAEALRTALPEFYADAVIQHDVDVIAPPEFEITEGQEDGAVTFAATVEIRPEVQISGYDDLRIEVPSPDVSDAEIDEQIDRIRSQYGELSPVSRPAIDGDYVQVDIHGTRDGEPVDGLTADDFKYLVGSGMVVPEFDTQLAGSSAGDVLVFEAQAPGADETDPIEFRLLVKGVEERILPDLTDDWVAEATEFETVAELRSDLRETGVQGRTEHTRSSVRPRIASALASLVEGEVPQSMVSAEMQSRLQSLAFQLEGRGIGLEDYLRFTGNDPESFSAELRAAAEESVRTDLALRAIALNEGLEASEELIDQEIEVLISGSDRSVEDARDQLRSEGQLSAVRSALLKRTAMEWLVERSVIVDPDGVPIDPELLVLPEQDHHDHDEDHDHDHDHHDDDLNEND